MRYHTIISVSGKEDCTSGVRKFLGRFSICQVILMIPKNPGAPGVPWA
jgi:hypothetical protein